MASFVGRRAALYAEPSKKEKKTLHLGGIVGGTAWVGALRYDARSLARGALLAAGAALRLRRYLRGQRRRS